MATVPVLRPVRRAQKGSRPELPFPGQHNSRPPWQTRYRRALIASDTAVIIGCVLAAQWVRLALLPGTVAVEVWFYYTTVSLIIAATWMGFLSVYRTRSPRIIGAGTEEYRRVFSPTLTFVGLTATALVFLRPEVARGYLGLALPLGICTLLLSRNLWRRLIAAQRKNGSCMSAIIAGLLGRVVQPPAVDPLAQILTLKSA
jgi:hypothetical protein